MKSFIEYLKEAAEEPTEGKHVKHSMHIEDDVLHHRNEGVLRAHKFLSDAHEHLLGNDTPDTNFSTKYDGSPSLVYGIHPKTKKFFVATKSAFNKDPKINYTPEDIERNHGHAPGLVKVMNHVLKHLSKTVKKGVFQGDVMYTKGEKDDNEDGRGVETKNGTHKFTPNTISYSTPEDSPEGKKITRSRMGIATHTEYKGNGDIENMRAQPISDESKKGLQGNPDVNQIDTKIKANPANYTAADQKEYHEHMGAATQLYKRMKPEALESLAGHGVNLEAHVNDMIRKGGEPSTDGYIKHLTDRHEKAVAKLKTPAARQKLIDTHSKDIEHITNNKKDFDKALELHKHLQNAKNVLTRVMSKNNPWGHSIGGDHTTQEGVAAVNKDGDLHKFVDREEFSKQNFLKGKMQAARKAATETPEEKHHWMWWGRGQPITKGHEQGINKTRDIAAEEGGTHNIMFSHSHDAKNPLTAEQKIKHAKRAFPGANISASTEAQPSILHHAAAAHAAGTTHLHVVAGADRVEQYKALLDKYNGVASRHGHYNFKGITVHSAGSRDPDAEGTEGISGTKMRAAAAANDRKTFHAGAPDTMTPQEKDDMMKDTQAGIKKFAPLQSPKPPAPKATKKK